LEGYVEHITKSWEGGGSERRGYIVLVQVPGVNTFEVSLGPLRRLLGLSRQPPEKVKTLMDHKPETVTFSGKCHQSSYRLFNNMAISQEFVEEWANKVRLVIC
jgi:hypothetical protein